MTVTVAVRSGRKIPARVKRAATHANRSRWVRLRGVADGRLQGVAVPEPAPEPAPEHVIRASCAGDAFHATCSCGEFATRKPTAERYARGAATRHLNKVREVAAQATTREAV